MSKAPIHPLWDEERLTVPDYLKIRAAVSGATRPLSTEDRLDKLKSCGAELRKHGIDAQLLFDVLAATGVDPDTYEVAGKSLETSIDDLSLQMLISVERDSRLKRSQPHLGARRGHLMPESLRREFAMALLEQAHALGLDIPEGLLSLLQVLLDPSLEFPPLRPDLRIAQAKAAIVIARQPHVSSRQIARSVGVDQSTAHRWSKPGSAIRKRATIIHKPVNSKAAKR